MNKTLIAALLAAVSIPAFASDYFVVVPVPNRTATAGNILVSLNGYSLPSGIVGHAYAGFDFNSVLQVKGDPNFSASSVHWSVAGGALPAGLSLSPDGKLTGTPTGAATSSFQVLAAYKTKAGQQAYQVLVADVSVTLSGATLPAGEQGAAYSYDFNQRLSVTDPQFQPGAVSWSVVDALPAGLTLNSNGTLTGIPTAEGAQPFTVKASYLGKSGQQGYQIVVASITVLLAGAALPAGVQGAAYSYDLKQKLSVTGDAAYTGGGVTWSVVGGTLPAGLSLGADGVISGTPSAENASTPVTIQAAYKTKSGQQAYTIVVGAITVALTSATPPGATMGQAYSGWDLKPNLSISGDAAYAGNGSGVTWSVTGGALPSGLSLNGDGTVTGTPSANGTNPVQVKALYKGKSATQSYTLSMTQNIAQNAGYRGWSDGTYAASCNAYLHPATGYKYAGATGTGVYRVGSSGSTTDVYCDMTGDGGGWTLVMRGLGGSTTGWGTTGALNAARSAATDASTGATFKLADATINQVRNGGMYRLKSDGLMSQTRFVAPFNYAHTTLLTQAMANTPPTVTYATVALTGAMPNQNLSQPFYYGISDDGGSWNTYFSTNRSSNGWSLGINTFNNGSDNTQYCVGTTAGCNFTMWVR